MEYISNFLNSSYSTKEDFVEKYDLDDDITLNHELDMNEMTQN